MKRKVIVLMILTGMLAMDFSDVIGFSQRVRAEGTNSISGGDIVSEDTRSVSENSVSGNGDLEDTVSGGDFPEDFVVIEHTDADITVVPDKYNTGAKGTLSAVELGQKVGDVQLATGNNMTTNVFDFVYRNGDVSGTIVFENMDFSKYPVALFNSEKINREIKLVFNNCKFSSVSMGKDNDLVSCEFSHCTMNSFYGSNAVFDYCQFGQSYSDGIVPFRNVKVSNSFFFDMTSLICTDKERHIDGTQIYGAEGVNATNISFDNCRFEVPAVATEGSTAYVNACIMLQMEYSNADGIRFADCTVNGGGYSIYARSKTAEYTLRNISFDHLKIGCAKKFGTFYGGVSQGVSISNVSETDSLYVGSVWKENGYTHISVTNDTNRERTLLICTDAGSFEYVISACPEGDQLASWQYSEFPFDIDIAIGQDLGYVLCFDTTTKGNAKQIRFVNWQGEAVYLDRETADALYLQQEEVVAYGSCGAEVEYTLTNTGILILTGKGSTYDYHSGKPAPWADSASEVKRIMVDAGVERLGNQLFAHCSGVTEVSLPEGLVSIGARTFAECGCLTGISLPGTILSIGDAAFSGTILQRAEYRGSDWNGVQLGRDNDKLTALILGQDIPESWHESENDVPKTDNAESSAPEQSGTEPSGSKKDDTESGESEKDDAESNGTEPSASKPSEATLSMSEQTQTETGEPETVDVISEVTPNDIAEMEVENLTDMEDISDEPIALTANVDTASDQTELSEVSDIPKEKVKVVVIYLGALLAVAGIFTTYGVIKILK